MRDLRVDPSEFEKILTRTSLVTHDGADLFPVFTVTEVEAAEDTPTGRTLWLVPQEVERAGLMRDYCLVHYTIKTKPSQVTTVDENIKLVDGVRMVPTKFNDDNIRKAYGDALSLLDMLFPAEAPSAPPLEDLEEADDEVRLAFCLGDGLAIYLDIEMGDIFVAEEGESHSRDLGIPDVEAIGEGIARLRSYLSVKAKEGLPDG